MSSKNINELLINIPDIYDLLSIDIDGDDYHVWKEMKKKARVVILEYHTGLPNDFPVVIKEFNGLMESYRPRKIIQKQLRENGRHLGYWGANMLAYIRLAKDKGYEFITSLSDNLIFVLVEEFEKLGIPKISEEYAIKDYFKPNKYWGVNGRDNTNQEWIIL